MNTYSSFEATAHDLDLVQPLTLHLHSRGNPDMSQYAAVSPPDMVRVHCLREASVACREYIERWLLGCGNWPFTEVFDADNTPVAAISYNGRVWLTKEKE